MSSQEDALFAMMSRKRALRDKYLRQPQEEGGRMPEAPAKRIPPTGKQNKVTMEEIIYRLGMLPPDAWEITELADNGNAVLRLPEFDAYMNSQGQPVTIVTLVLTRKVLMPGRCVYRMSVDTGLYNRGILPDLSDVTIHEEARGNLADFMDSFIENLQSGWMMVGSEFAERRKWVREAAQNLKDFEVILRTFGPQISDIGFLIQVQDELTQILQTETEQISKLPSQFMDSGHGQAVRDFIFLLSAAVKLLDGIMRASVETEYPDNSLQAVNADSLTKQLDEIIMLLNSAAESI